MRFENALLSRYFLNRRGAESKNDAFHADVTIAVLELATSSFLEATVFLVSGKNRDLGATER